MNLSTYLAYTLLTFLIVCNVNGLLVMLTDSNRIASPFILASAATLLIKFRSSLLDSLAGPGRIYILLIILYLPGSILIGLLSGGQDLVSLQTESLANLNSVVLVLAFATVGYNSVILGNAPRIFAVASIASLISTASAFIEIAFPAWPALFAYRANQSDRVSGFFANPNELGMITLITIGLCTHQSAITRKSLWFYMGLVLSLVAAFYSLSRASIISGVLLGSAGLLYLAKIQPSQRLANLAIVVALSTLVVGSPLQRLILDSSPLASSSNQRRIDLLITLLADGAIDDETTGGRTALALEGFQRGMESPIVGHGLGSMRRLPSSGLGPHNTIVRVFGEGGVAPALLIIILVFSLATCALKTKISSARILIASTTFIALVNMTTSHEWLTDRVQNLMLGLTIGVAAAHERGTRTTKSSSENSEL